MGIKTKWRIQQSTNGPILFKADLSVATPYHPLRIRRNVGDLKKSHYGYMRVTLYFSPMKMTSGAKLFSLLRQPDFPKKVITVYVMSLYIYYIRSLALLITVQTTSNHLHTKIYTLRKKLSTTLYFFRYIFLHQYC